MDQLCDHPINMAKKKSTGYWCLKCRQKIKRKPFNACQHGYKIGTCMKCMQSQRTLPI